MTMSSHDAEKSRRNLLKSIAAGGVVTTTAALPAKWSRPVVDAVALPAHAQTTGVVVAGGGGGGAGGVVDASGSPLDLLVQEAHAAGAYEFRGCVSISYIHDGSGNIDGLQSVTLDVLNVGCGSSPSGGPSVVNDEDLFTFATGVPMVNVGGMPPFNWSVDVSGIGGRTYRVALEFSKHTAAAGEVFGTCTVSNPNGPGGGMYAPFQVRVGTGCPTISSDECEWKPE
jgi:hypothetical protein